MGKIILTLIAIFFTFGLTSCAHSPAASSLTPVAYAAPQGTAANNPLWQGSPETTWDQLQHFSTAKLTDMQSKTNDTFELGWLKLAILTKQKKVNTQQMADALLAWQEAHPNHPAMKLLPSRALLEQLKISSSPKQIAILIPQTGSLQSASAALREGFLNSYYVNMPTGTKQKVKFYDTSNTPLPALYQQAVAEGADFIIGPLTKSEVQQLRASINFKTPTLALNYTNDQTKLTNFYEYGLLPEDEVVQMANRARRAGLQKALLIAPQTEWGKRLSSAFEASWVKAGGSIEDIWYFNNRENFNEEVAQLLKVNMTADKRLMKKNNNKEALEQQRRQDVDVIILISQAQDARLIVPLLRFYYAGRLPIYATSSVYAKKADPGQAVDLNGVTVCDIPINLQPHEENKDKLYAVGQDAYLLSQSLERLINLPQFPVYGSTGALTMSSLQQIRRRLPCIEIQHELS